MLEEDPIIVFYENILKKSQHGAKLPEFSEIYLRVAFINVFGENYTIDPAILKLYRKLLVLHYSQQYPTIACVLSIMERCFNRDEITNILAEEDHIRGMWQQFIKSEMRDNESDAERKRRQSETMSAFSSNKRNRLK